MSHKIRTPLSEEMKQQFAGLVVLDYIFSFQTKIHASLMDNNDQHLSPVLNQLEKEDVVAVSDEDVYVVTEKGEQVYDKLMQQHASYAIHFDIFSHVDLANGTFAIKGRDLLEGEHWEDLRVAVAEFKGVDPYRVVFLALLSDQTFFENSDWKYDLALGVLFEEMEEIVHSQVTEEELGYDSDTGFISGQDVLQDVIEQGSVLNKERYEKEMAARKEREQRQASGENEEEEVVTTTTYHGGGYGYYPYYDPWVTFGSYAASALFIEALWRDPYW
jgi:DNA-binding PadR family transcriptional regulator